MEYFIAMEGHYLTPDRAWGEGKRVVVALSGGVDSSVAALLLKRSGFDVIGITMKNFCYGDSEAGDRSCCSIESIEDARRVCSEIGIIHRVVDVEEQFSKEVVGDFINEYQKARTPNPCVRCNSAVRFNSLSLFAELLGAEFLATGHYSRIFVTNEGRKFIATAKDKEKDQSYFLSALDANKIAGLLLPLGDYTKDEVREIARKASLPVASKRDSQEVCFITDGDLGRYLKKSINFAPGPIVNSKGKVLGSHEGIFSYTVGQRKNLGLSVPCPHYVLELDSERNALVVGEEEELYKEGLRCSLVWIDEVLVNSPADSTGTGSGILGAKIRSRHNPAPIEGIVINGAICRVKFKKSQRAICPGQTIAFYKGDLLIGSGVIDEAYD